MPRQSEALHSLIQQQQLNVIPAYSYHPLVNNNENGLTMAEDALVVKERPYLAALVTCRTILLLEF
jgi:hypothetical protein